MIILLIFGQPAALSDDFHIPLNLISVMLSDRDREKDKKRERKGRTTIPTNFNRKNK